MVYPGIVGRGHDPQLGVFPGMPNEEYRKVNAISASDIKTMSISIDMFIKKTKLAKRQSSAMDIGTAVHTALLEPDKFRMSEMRLKPTEKKALGNMVKNARAIFGSVLEKTENEVSVITKDDVFIRKCRPDAMIIDLGVVFDVKTSRYGDQKSFYRNDILGRNYDIQAAWYIDTLRLAGINIDSFVFLVVQNISPHMCYAVEVHESVIERGRSKYGDILKRYLEYVENKNILDIRTVYDWEYIKDIEGG